MIIALGSDHAGFQLKIQIREYVRSLNHQVLDLGTERKVLAE